MTLSNRNSYIEVLENNRLLYTISMSNYLMTIAINKSIYTSLNGKCEIVIQNLDNDIVESLENIYKNSIKTTTFKISIKYNDTVILQSSLVNLNNVYSANDSTTYTTLYLYLGWEAYNTKINKIYEKGTKVTDVLDDMIKETGLNPDILNSESGCLSRDRSVLKDITMNGNVIDSVKKLLQKCIDEGTNEVYVEDETVKVVPNTYFNQHFTITDTNAVEPIPQINDYGVTLSVPFEQFLNINCMDKIKLNISKKYVQYQFEDLTTSRLNEDRVNFQGEYKVTDLLIRYDNFSTNIAIAEIKAIKI